jgi:cephalosporin-C deacetylase-like acetyl esterase
VSSKRRGTAAVDASRIAFTGGSQGGGITLMVAGLVPDLVAARPDVPFLCQYRRSLELATEGPYPEVERYLRIHRYHVDRVFTALSYSTDATARPGPMRQPCSVSVLFSVGPVQRRPAGCDLSTVDGLRGVQP